MEKNQKTLIRDNEENIYSPDPYAECSSLSEATTLQGAYEMRSIQPTTTNVVSTQIEEITASQETRDALRKGKKCNMLLFITFLNMFCFICLCVATVVTNCKIFEK